MPIRGIHGGLKQVTNLKDGEWRIDPWHPSSVKQEPVHFYGLNALRSPFNVVITIVLNCTRGFVNLTSTFCMDLRFRWKYICHFMLFIQDIVDIFRILPTLQNLLSLSIREKLPFLQSSITNFHFVHLVWNLVNDKFYQYLPDKQNRPRMLPWATLSIALPPLYWFNSATAK